MLGLVLSAIINGWWAILRGPDLLTRSDNPRRTLADLYVPRGNILDRNNKPIVITKGTSGELSREYLYPNLSPVTGYTNSIYGQAGIEFALDEYLRGLAGNPTSTIWWNQLLYGQPPSGLDLRLSIDIDLQEDVDQRLSKHKGAVVLINAQSGEILVMSSHPTFDANQLDETVLNDENSPLINRATQGQYPISITETSLFFKTSEIRTIIRIPVEDGSPIEMAIAASALSNAGLAPAPRLALAVNTPQSEWVILPALGEETQLFTQSETDSFLKNFTTDNGAYWHFLVADEKENITWLLAGTTKNWQGAPLGLVILLEENNAGLAEEIAKSLLSN